MNKAILILSFILLSQIANAQVHIAFIEVRNWQGEIVQLEPNGQFAHVAVSYQDQWLHSHPLRGVEIVGKNELEKIGKIKEIITLTELKPLTYNNIRGYLGLAYDSEYEWSDTKIYCSELVAKLLNIKPRPMYFDSKLWPDYYSQYQGMPGISPDALYWLLSHSIRIGRLYGNTSSL